MAIAQLGDRGGMSSNTTGTGDVTLNAALGAVPPNVCSYIDFATTGITNGQLVSYLILDSNGAFECGRATFNTVGPQLTGRTPIRSSNSGGLINLSGVSVQVFITALAEDIGPAAILHVDAAQGLGQALKAIARLNIYNAPTIQVFLSGSGTYNLPSGPAPLWIRVTCVGGGGGGGSSGTGGAPTNGGAGGNTTFGAALLTANGGGGGLAGLGGGGGFVAGGTATGGDINFPGQVGAGIAGSLGGQGTSAGGGNSVLFTGAGAGTNGSAGVSGIANTGGGGGGGGAFAAATNGGGGGGGGGSLTKIINAPAATYLYAVGAGGTAGVAGTSGAAGGTGGSGIIIVEEFYI